MKALEGSLASTVEHSKSLEAKLSAAECELVNARTESTKLAREGQELRAALAERDGTIAQLKANTMESEAESEQSRCRLMALRQAGQAVVGRLGAAVLSAQEASSKPRPLEDILIPLATGEERKREEQLRANFEAVFDAYAHTLAELEEQTKMVILLGPAVSELRDAMTMTMTMTLKDKAPVGGGGGGGGGAPPAGSKQEGAQGGAQGGAKEGAQEGAKLEEAERAWRERCAAHREPGVAPVAESETFEVVVPTDAQPGDIMTLTTQTGQRMKVVVPEGAEPGDTLTLAMTG